MTRGTAHGERAPARGNSARAALAWPCALALALAAPGSPRADDFSGRAIVGYTGNDTDEIASRAFHQLYDLRIRRSITDPIDYRLSLRYEDDRGSNVVLGKPGSTQSRLVQPAVVLYYNLSAVTGEAGYDLTHSDAFAQSLRTDSRDLRRVYARLTLRPDDLPGLTLYGDRRTADDATTSTRQTDTLLTQDLDYAWRAVKLGQGARYTTFEDQTREFRRETVEGLLRAEYDGPLELLPGGRLTATNLVNGTRLQELSLGAATVDVPNPVTPGRGLYSHDDHPGVAPSVPMAALPALVDGNTAVSTGISLGPDGSSFQNVGLDLGRFVALDLLRVHVRSAAGNLVPTGGPVTWDLFTSADGSTWLPYPGASTSYDSTLGYYEVQFPRVTVRFIKAVSFGTNGLETFVTELQPLGIDRLQPQERRTTLSFLDSFTTAVSTQPLRSLTLRYNALLNASTQRPHGSPTISSLDADQALSALYQPSSLVSLDGRLERRNLLQSGSSQRTDIVSATLQLTPRRELRTGLTATRTSERALRVSDTNALSWFNYLLVYRTLDVAVDTGVSRQEWPSEGQRVDRYYLSGVSVGRLTRDLTLTLTASIQRSDSSTSATLTPDLVLPVQRQEQFAGELFYRASAQLQLSMRLGYTSADLASGWIQRYRVAWNPFPGGAIQVGGSFDQDVDAVSQLRSSRANAFFRWRLNPHAAFDATYNTVRVHNLVDSRVDGFGLTLTLNV